MRFLLQSFLALILACAHLFAPNCELCACRQKLVSGRLIKSHDSPVVYFFTFNLFFVAIMVFIVLSLLLLKSLIAITKASPVSTAAPSSKDLGLPLFNTSHFNNATLGTNFNALTLPSVLPYSFAVPGTQTFLRLGFGLRRRRLDPLDLGGLIAAIEDLIVQGINRDGDHWEPGVDPIFRYQYLEYSLGDGFHWEVYTDIPARDFVSWGQLKNVVKGLELYLVQGQRPYATVFSFWDGPRSWTTPPLGHGVIALGNDPRVESADQKL